MAKTRMYFIAGILLCLVCWNSSLSFAQQPTATISSLRGTVLAVIGGEEIEARLEMVLTAGDAIQTRAGSEASLTLSEGSVIQLGENTKLDIAVLLKTRDTAVRQSRLKLLYGHLRAFLSFGHQQEGAAFEVETPNAQVGVKFSQPDVSVSYDPTTKTTIVRAYTVDVGVVNLLTKAEIARMPKQHQAIIREEFILVTRIMDLSGLIEQIQRMALDGNALVEAEMEEEGWTDVNIEREAEEEPMAAEPGQATMDLLLENRLGTANSISSAPRTDVATSEPPTLGARTDSAESGVQTTEFDLTITEE